MNLPFKTNTGFVKTWIPIALHLLDRFPVYRDSNTCCHINEQGSQVRASSLFIFSVSRPLSSFSASEWIFYPPALQGKVSYIYIGSNGLIQNNLHKLNWLVIFVLSTDFFPLHLSDLLDLRSQSVLQQTRLWLYTLHFQIQGFFSDFTFILWL